jgi:hypothetical protein
MFMARCQSMVSVPMVSLDPCVNCLFDRLGSFPLTAAAMCVFVLQIYTQLSKLLSKVFFPSHDPALQALSFWGVYAGVTPLSSPHSTGAHAVPPW